MNIWTNVILNRLYVRMTIKTFYSVQRSFYIWFLNFMFWGANANQLPVSIFRTNEKTGWPTYEDRLRFREKKVCFSPTFHSLEIQFIWLWLLKKKILSGAKQIQKAIYLNPYPELFIQLTTVKKNSQKTKWNKESNMLSLWIFMAGQPYVWMCHDNLRRGKMF